MTEPTASHLVTSLDELLTIYPQRPVSHSLSKEVPRLTPAYRRMIEAAPFCTIATNGDNGLDCSPRGDSPGFVTVLDDATLCLPDRRGNNRLDTLRNIIADPRVAILFLIPGKGETLRVNGRAHISRDPALLTRHAVDGKEPATVLLVQIEAVYFQCARAIMRSKLWQTDAPATDLPTAGEMTRQAAPASDFDSVAYDAILRPRQRDSLY